MEQFSESEDRQVFPSLLQGEPKSIPTWVPDESRSSCFICSKAFSLFIRKHHCRRCGEIACTDCSSKKTILYEFLPTNHEEEIPNDPKGKSYQRPLRVCDRCFEERSSVLEFVETKSEGNGVQILKKEEESQEDIEKSQREAERKEREARERLESLTRKEEEERKEAKEQREKEAKEKEERQLAERKEKASILLQAIIRGRRDRRLAKAEATRAQKRRNVSLELLATERSYVDSLLTCVEVPNLN